MGVVDGESRVVVATFLHGNPFITYLHILDSRINPSFDQGKQLCLLCAWWVCRGGVVLESSKLKVAMVVCSYITLQTGCESNLD